MEKKVVLVTGGGRGIGAAIVYEFAKEDYNVVIDYVEDEDAAYALRDKIVSEFSIEPLVIKADVSKETEVKEMINQIINKFGRIDVLVNNAGIAIDTTVEDKTVDDFIKTLSVNLVGQFICARECAKVMTEGSIINISSTNGIDTYYPYSLDYDASKAGVISLTKNLAVEYAPNIRVNSIAPGWVMTDMNALLDADYIKEETEKILLGRFAEPAEIAYLAVFLASDKAAYINGEVIKVDGGK